jgi:DNA repair protein RecO (recombination protein O)
MRFTTPAIIVSLRPHAEHGGVVRMLTPEHGLHAAYVRGARGRRMRPVLMAGNQVEASLSARTEGQLAQATVELLHSRGPLLAEPLPAAAIDWASALTATALPEGLPYPRLYEALDGLLAAIEAAPAASGWGAALVRYELLLLAELGFGLDLESCAATGARGDLIYVSPKSGRAVSREAGEPWRDKLLRLPDFLQAGTQAPTREELAHGFALTGFFMARHVLEPRGLAAPHERAQFIAAVMRAVPAEAAAGGH